MRDAVGVAKLRNDCYNSLLLHELLGEVAIDSGGNLSSLCFKGIGCNAEIVS